MKLTLIVTGLLLSTLASTLQVASASPEEPGEMISTQTPDIKAPPIPNNRSVKANTVKSTAETSSLPQKSKNLPLNLANMSDAAIINWASNAVKDAYSYDFKNYHRQIQEIQKNFTPQGWTAFMTALNKSNNLNVVQNRKLVASGTLTGKPVILQKGIKNGVYTWKLQVPMLATYESESRLIKQNLEVTLLVTRDNSQSGIGISHFVAVIVPSSQPITTPPAITSTPSTTNATPTPTGAMLAPSIPSATTIPASNAPENTTGTSTANPTTVIPTPSNNLTSPTLPPSPPSPVMPTPTTPNEMASPATPPAATSNARSRRTGNP